MIIAGFEITDTSYFEEIFLITDIPQPIALGIEKG